MCVCMYKGTSHTWACHSLTHSPWDVMTKSSFSTLAPVWLSSLLANPGWHVALFPFNNPVPWRTTAGAAQIAAVSFFSSTC